MILQRQYRRRIEKSRSSALKKLSASVKISMLVLFLDILAIFITSKILITEYKSSLSLLDRARTMTGETKNIAHYGRLMELIATNTGPQSVTVNDTYLQLSKWSSSILDDVDLMYSTTQFGLLDYVGDKKIKNFWYEERLTEKIYLKGDQSKYVESSINMNSLMNHYETNARIVADLPIDKLQDPSQISEWRYLYDNKDTLFEELDLGIGKYQDLNYQHGKLFEDAMVILLCVTFAILVGLIAILFVPSIKMIKKERGETLNLFLAIPKATVANLHNALTAEKDDVNVFLLFLF